MGALGFEGSFLTPRPMLSAPQVSSGGTVAELWPRNGVGWTGGSQAQRSSIRSAGDTVGSPGPSLGSAEEGLRSNGVRSKQGRKTRREGGETAPESRAEEKRPVSGVGRRPSQGPGEREAQAPEESPLQAQSQNWLR